MCTLVGYFIFMAKRLFILAPLLFLTISCDWFRDPEKEEAPLLTQKVNQYMLDLMEEVYLWENTSRIPSISVTNSMHLIFMKSCATGPKTGGLSSPTTYKPCLKEAKALKRPSVIPLPLALFQIPAIILP